MFVVSFFSACFSIKIRMIVSGRKYRARFYSYVFICERMVILVVFFRRILFQSIWKYVPISYLDNNLQCTLPRHFDFLYLNQSRDPILITLEDTNVPRHSFNRKYRDIIVSHDFNKSSYIFQYVCLFVIILVKQKLKILGSSFWIDKIEWSIRSSSKR